MSTPNPNIENEKSSTYTKLILKNGNNGAFIIGGGSQLSKLEDAN